MRITYTEKKKKLINNISVFISNENLFELADASIIINTILRENRFPIREYKEWLKQKK